MRAGDEIGENFLLAKLLVVQYNNYVNVHSDTATSLMEVG